MCVVPQVVGIVSERFILPTCTLLHLNLDIGLSKEEFISFHKTKQLLVLTSHLSPSYKPLCVDALFFFLLVFLAFGIPRRVVLGLTLSK